METTPKANNKHKVSPERKYIRLQIVGLAFICAWPVAMILAAMFGISGRVIFQVSVLQVYGGIAFLCAGHIGQQELKKKSNEKKFNRPI